MSYDRRSLGIASYGLGLVAMSLLSVKRLSKRVGSEVNIDISVALEVKQRKESII